MDSLRRVGRRRRGGTVSAGRRGRWAGAAAVVLAVVPGLTACGSGAPGDVSALELQVADCFNDPGIDAVTEVVVVPCVEPHDYEVFHAFELAEGPFPGAGVVQRQWRDGCLARFEEFVGTPFPRSVLEVSALFPTERTWNELDDREVVCSVTALDGIRREGSARGARI